MRHLVTRAGFIGSYLVGCGETGTVDAPPHPVDGGARSGRPSRTAVSVVALASRNGVLPWVQLAR